MSRGASLVAAAWRQDASPAPRAANEQEKLEDPEGSEARSAAPGGSPGAVRGQQDDKQSEKGNKRQTVDPG